MTDWSIHLPVLQVVVPLLTAPLAALLRQRGLAWAATTAASLLAFAMAIEQVSIVLDAGAQDYDVGSWPAPYGIELTVDAFSALLLLIVTGASSVALLMAHASFSREIPGERQHLFYAAWLLTLAGLSGIVVAGDAFNIFVFMEIASLGGYILIAGGPDRRALPAAFKYLIMGTIGATFYVIGVGLLFLLTGSLNIVDIASRLGAATAEQFRPAMAALAFLTVGISLKLALFPLHVWLPNAYAYAPSFATAFLAATATKVAVYLLLRFLFSVFGIAVAANVLQISDLLLALSIAAMFVASILAVYEENVKRMLAYSSIAQIGYITFGISLANKAGLTGGIVHLFNHAVMKGALFLALGAVAYRLGTVKLADLGGLGRKMPLTFAAFVIAGFGLVGTPGTAGFISKWYLAVGALDKGWWPLVFLIVASSLISVVYIGRVVEVAYFRPSSGACETAKDPPLSMLIPILLLGAATIYFGIDTQLTVGIASKAAEALVGGLK